MIRLMVTWAMVHCCALLFFSGRQAWSNGGASRGEMPEAALALALGGEDCSPVGANRSTTVCDGFAATPCTIGGCFYGVTCRVGCTFFTDVIQGGPIDSVGQFDSPQCAVGGSTNTVRSCAFSPGCGCTGPILAVGNCTATYSRFLICITGE